MTDINEIVDKIIKKTFNFNTLVNVKNRWTQITLEEKLNKYKKINEKGCWIWIGSSMYDGRGQIRIENKLYLVPRLILHLYKKFNLEDKLHVLHKCNIPACFNPDHLYVGDDSDNIQDRYKRYGRVTHCRQGHEYTKENTLINQFSIKLCKTCAKLRRERNKQWK